jgi:tellurite resistance protein
MAQRAATTAEQHAAYMAAHSHSQVANVLRNPGKVVYTNKERIASELEAKLHNIADTYGVELDALERDVKQAALPPKTVIDTLKGLIAQLDAKVATAPAAGGGILDAEQKAIILTIPYGLGQLTLSVLGVSLYMAITFIALVGTVWSAGMFLGAYNPFGATALLKTNGLSKTIEFYKGMKGEPNKKNPNFLTPNPMMAQPPY